MATLPPQPASDTAQQNPYVVPPNTGYPPQYPYYRKEPTGFGLLLHNIGAKLSRHWLAIVIGVIAAYVIVPWSAPLFARLGLWNIANGIYTVYEFLCHQLPERTAHLFGYEVALCWRCSAIYAAFSLTGIVFSYARERGGFFSWLLTPMALPLFFIALTPIGVDGLSHALGFRADNAWFDSLTGGAFGSFSVGDSVGTLNWWLRISSGGLMGFAAAWLILPWVQRAINESRNPYGVPPQLAVGS